MSALDRLVPVAVLGVARRHLDDDVLAELGGVDALDLPPAPALLRAAARASVLDRISLPEGAGDIGPGPPPEVLPAPSRHYGGTLAQAIGGHRWAAVAETLGVLASRGLRLPVGMLHRVLEAAVDHRELRPLLPPVLGERGLWLARANPRWSFGELAFTDLATDETARAEAWQAGSRAQRLAWFAALRAADPERARELLSADLAQEDAAMRAELLAHLDHRLDAADEPLLEAALDDRGRDVRAVASRLLPRLPDSAFVRRMCHRVLDRVRVANGRWQVDLDGLDDVDARDGVVVDRAERPIGAQAVRALVAGVPLAFWPVALGSTAYLLVGIRDGILELGPVPGLRDAAVRERDALVAAAVLSHPRWPADPELVGCLIPARGAAGDQEAGAGAYAGLDEVLARRVQVLSPPKAVPELAVVGFGPVTAGILLAWAADNRSAGLRASVLQVLGDHGPLRLGDPGGGDLAADLRRLAAGLTGADRNRALDAAMTLNLRRALAAEARPEPSERTSG